MKRCVYAGSFDPATHGHLWMIREGARLFDELVVAIGVNPVKKYGIPLGRRLATLAECLAGIPNVRVVSFSADFLADYARRESIGFILRGIRGESDYEYERGMRYVNEDLHPGLTTVFLIPPRSLAKISSSMVKGLIGPIGWESVIRKYLPGPVYRDVLGAELARAFEALWAAVSGRPAEPRFLELAARYSQPHRHYHNLAHVAACLGELAQLSLPDGARRAIELAIRFHDAVYDAPSKGNERESAEYFQRVAAEDGIGAATREEVTGMILATEKHEAPPGADPALTAFLDMDLSILGAGPERFREYDQGIRREYASIPDLIYNLKRRQVLRGFLEREHLFFTREFRERYERAARENIRRALGDE